jgi:hypothetical protein
MDLLVDYFLLHLVVLLEHVLLHPLIHQILLVNSMVLLFLHLLM